MSLLHSGSLFSKLERFTSLVPYNQPWFLTENVVESPFPSHCIEELMDALKYHGPKQYRRQQIPFSQTDGRVHLSRWMHWLPLVKTKSAWVAHAEMLFLAKTMKVMSLSFFKNWTETTKNQRPERHKLPPSFPA